MLQTTKRTIATLTAAACLGSAGWAIAGTGNGSSSTAGQASQSTATDAAIAATSTAATTTPTAPQGRPAQQSPVTGAAAEKIKATVLAKVPGATIDRVEQDAQGYHAHITKSDGTRATARVNAQFVVTSVAAGRGPGGPGVGGPGGDCPEGAPPTGESTPSAGASGASTSESAA